MLDRIQQKLGTAGLIVSVVALVAALGGGAYAASGALTGKQKKEVTKIATKFSGKAGPAGPAGPTGPTGPTGAQGAQGASGANGAAVTTAPVPTSSSTCNHLGGTEFNSAGSKSVACNGAQGVEGSPYTAGGVLPSGSTETGTWAYGPVAEGTVRVPFSFTIPLAAEVAVHFMAPGAAETTECPSEKVEVNAVFVLEPKAAPGNLCVYQQGGFGGEFTAAQNPETGLVENESGKVGALLVFTTEEGSAVRGTWAVTAP